MAHEHIARTQVAVRRRGRSPRRIIQKTFPGLAHIREHRALSVLGQRLHDPNLWHLNRHSVSGASAVGVFLAFAPLPFQMLLAAVAALVLRVNLAISVTLVWISNPFTMAAIYYGAYRLGQRLLGEPPGAFHFELSLGWVTHELERVWEPLAIGCLVLASVAAPLAYGTVRLLWRAYVVRLHKRRPGRYVTAQ